MFLLCSFLKIHGFHISIPFHYLLQVNFSILCKGLRATVCTHTCFATLFVEKLCFFPVDCLGTFVKKANDCILWVHFWTFYSVLWIYTSIFTWFCCFVESSESKCSTSWNFVLLVQNCFDSLHLHVPINFGISELTPIEIKTIGILIENL